MDIAVALLHCIHAINFTLLDGTLGIGSAQFVYVTFILKRGPMVADRGDLPRWWWRFRLRMGGKLPCATATSHCAWCQVLRAHSP